MADFADELKTWMKTQASITSLVGSGVNARIYPDMPRQGAALPFITYVEVGGSSNEHHGGISGIAEAVFHIYAFGATRTAANDLAEAIRLAMQTFRGTMGSTAVSWVSASVHRDADVDKARDKNDKHRYWCRRIYSIFHAEPTS